MIAWLRSALKRLSPRARLVAIAAAALVALNILASALTPTPHHHTGRNPARPVPSTVTSADGRQREPSAVSAAELGRVRQAASRFLESYLPFAYGRAPAGGQCRRPR